MAWKPLLQGKPRDEAAASIQRVVDGIVRVDASTLPTDLPSGLAGLALTCYYAGVALDRPDYVDVSGRFLEAAIERIASTDSWPALHGGFVGVAWTAQHLQDQSDAIPKSDLTDVDRHLIDHVNSLPPQVNFDLATGLTGIAVYALERWPAPTAETILRTVISKLCDLTEANKSGVTWLTPPVGLLPQQRRAAPDGIYDLGMSHGIGGVIALLGRASGLDVLEDRGVEALERGVDWLMAQAGDRDGFLFPGWIAKNADLEKLPRLAWCYGDLGIAAALAVANECHAGQDWSRHVMRIAENCCSISRADSHVIDSCLCHGSAGNAHVFNRLRSVYDSGHLTNASRRWLRTALDERRANAAYDGYASWDSADGSNDGSFGYHPRMLTGAAGVALALSATISNTDPAWDRCLLISSHARERQKHNKTDQA